MKDHVRPSQRQAPRRFGKYHVVTNQEPHASQVGGREDRKAIAALLVQLVNGQVDLVIAPDLLAIAAQKEGGVADRAFVIHRVTRADEVHPVLQSRPAQPLQHALHGFGQNVLQASFVGRFPGSEAQRVFGKGQRVALGGAGLVDDFLQLAKRLVQLIEDCRGRRQPPIDQAGSRLRRPNTDQPARGRVRFRGRTKIRGQKGDEEADQEKADPTVKRRFF